MPEDRKNMGSKVNDFKALYGAMFKDELEKFTHWGWFDVDVLVAKRLGRHSNLVCTHTAKNVV